MDMAGLAVKAIITYNIISYKYYICCGTNRIFKEGLHEIN